MNLIVEELKQTPVERQRVEIVERKGVGHPDSMCDAIMDQISVALSREYLATFGRILHHNIDKGLLVAGRTEPRLGGGQVLEPMRLVLGDRATAEYRGKRIDVGGIAEATAKLWLRQHLRYVDPDEHIRFQNEIKEGSPELTDIFERETIGANDTSAAVGYAPLSETERLVLGTERKLNSKAFKQAFPVVGEDVKVMGYRQDSHLTLTVAIAFVDRHVPDGESYFEVKGAIQSALKQFLDEERASLDDVQVEINMLDDPQRGEEGMYLTVLGTSAEGADGGQVGRGNRVNGLIALNRPMSTEAAAGKNPVSHVGKIYTLLAHECAAEIHSKVDGIAEVYVWLGSRIGEPIDRPYIASAQLSMQPGADFEEVQPYVDSIIREQLEGIYGFTQRLAKGELSVY